MDITTQSVIDTAAIHIKGADGEHLYDAKGKPCRIVIYGPGSKQYAALDARQTNRAVKRMQDNDNKVTVPSAEQRVIELAEDLASITAAFENFTYPPAGDKQGQELFEMLYADQKLGYIAKQIVKACADWGNFKPGSLPG